MSDMKNQNELNRNELNRDEINQDEANRNEANRNEANQDEAYQDELNRNEANRNESNRNKKDRIARIKASFAGRKFKSGAYATILSAVVIVLVLVVNLIVSEMDLKVDLSTQGLYTLTDSTKDLVKDLKDDITIYYLAKSNSGDSVFRKIADKYDSLSEHIKLVDKDPVLYPKFTSQYVDNEITANSFLVVNERTQRARYVDSSEMVINEMDYNTWQSYTTGLDVEGKLTSAIQYVASEDLPVLYATTGHSENEPGELFESILDKQNVTVNKLQTLTAETIPGDCDILFINAPEKDFTDGEMTIIRDYMAQGGNVVIVLDYMAESLRNVKSLLEYYGVEIKDGIVCEGDASRHVPQLPHYIVPEIRAHEITGSITENKRFVITPVSSGLSQIENVRSSLKITPLLVTSDKAYSKVNVNAATFTKELGDLDGPFNIGLLASDTYNGVTSNLVVYTSELIFHDSSLEGYGNEDLLKSTINYLTGDSTAVSVKVRSMIPEAIRLTQQQAVFWGGVTVIALPALILTTGIIVNVRRRKR